MLIHNNNGHSYTILSSKGDYSLLERTTEGTSRYVVAWNLKKLDNGNYEWGQGHYFEKIENAKACFDKK
jgi:myo-inositol-hexaphosphate 3-phosphohydrolase